MRDHFFDGQIFISYIVLLQLLVVLIVGGRDYGLDQHGVHHLLEGLILPLDPLVLL